VSFAALNGLMDGYLNLRGKPSHYLPPAVARGILDRAVDPDRMTKPDRLVFQMPVGSADLPDPTPASAADPRPGHNLGSGADRHPTAVAATESGARARPAAARPRRTRPAPPWCARPRATRPYPAVAHAVPHPLVTSLQTAGNVGGERRVAPTTRSTHPRMRQESP